MTEPPPIKVDYASPPPQGARPVTAVGLTLLLSFIYLFMMAMAFFVAPRLETIFAEFDAELPGVTVVFIGICRWIRSGFGWAILLLVPIVLPIIVARMAWQRESAKKRGLRLFGMIGITLFLLAGFVLFTALSLFLPLVRLMDAASAPAR